MNKQKKSKLILLFTIWSVIIVLLLSPFVLSLEDWDYTGTYYNLSVPGGCTTSPAFNSFFYDSTTDNFYVFTRTCGLSNYSSDFTLQNTITTNNLTSTYVTAVTFDPDTGIIYLADRVGAVENNITIHKFYLKNMSSAGDDIYANTTTSIIKGEVVSIGFNTDDNEFYTSSTSVSTNNFRNFVLTDDFLSKNAYYLVANASSIAGLFYDELSRKYLGYWTTIDTYPYLVRIFDDNLNVEDYLFNLSTKYTGNVPYVNSPNLYGQVYYSGTRYLLFRHNKSSAPYLNVVALSYADTNQYYEYGGYNYSRIFCINENYLCNYTNYVVEPLSSSLIYNCLADDIADYCPSACENTLTGNLYSGACGILGCENECVIDGEYSCFNSKTEQICGNFDDDVCLEYGASNSCLADEICVNSDTPSYTSGCVTANISLGNYEAFYGLFSLVPQIYLTGIVDYNEFENYTRSFDANTNTLSIDTQYNLFNQKYQLSSSSKPIYFGYVCDYKADNHFYLSDNATTGFTCYGGCNYSTETTGNYINITTDVNKTYATISGNQRLSLKFFSDSTISSNISIDIYNSLGQQVTNTTWLVVNRTDLYTAVYFGDAGTRNLLYTDTDPSGTDLATDFIITFNFDVDTNTYTTKLDITRTSGTWTHYSISNPLKNTFVDASRISIKNYTVSDLSQYAIKLDAVWYDKINNNYPTFKYVVNGSYDNANCNYADDGTYYIRGYANIYGLPLFDKWTEVKVLFNGGNTNAGNDSVVDTGQLSSADMIESLFGSASSTSDKIFRSALYLFVVAFVFLICGAIVGNFPVFATIALIIDLLLIVSFTLAGVIPVWIFAVVLIVASMIGYSLFRNWFSGSGGE